MNSSSLVESWTVASVAPRGERNQLIRFWLACPDDALDSLWNTALGQATSELVLQLTPTTYLDEEQITLRNQLGTFLQAGFQQPGAVKAVIATFLLSPPGNFRIVNPESHLPSWLVPSYNLLYENTHTNQQQQTKQQPQTHAKSDSSSLGSRIDNNPSLTSPDFGVFPVSLSELTSNRIQLNRMLGLSNLFYIDPEDIEIRNELLEFRANLINLLMSAGDADLEKAFASDFGDRFWALVRSGIQSVPLDAQTERIKQRVKDNLSPEKGGGFGKPGAISSFMVAMTLYQPGSMKVDDAERKLPSWLYSGYQEVFANAISS